MDKSPDRDIVGTAIKELEDYGEIERFVKEYAEWVENNVPGLSKHQALCRIKARIETITSKWESALMHASPEYKGSSSANLGKGMKW
ncbi:MAG: hypothetical protein Q8O21_00575 [bacterium]|nr:hypothetical protein [bacterium]